MGPQAQGDAWLCSVMNVFTKIWRGKTIYCVGAYFINGRRTEDSTVCRGKDSHVTSCFNRYFVTLSPCVEWEEESRRYDIRVLSYAEVWGQLITNTKHLHRDCSHLWRKHRRCAPGHGRPSSAEQCKRPHIPCVPSSVRWRIRRCKSPRPRCLKDAAGHLVDRDGDLRWKQILPTWNWSFITPTISEPADLLLGSCRRGGEGAPQGQSVTLLHPCRREDLVKLGFLHCSCERINGEEGRFGT